MLEIAIYNMIEIIIDIVIARLVILFGLEIVRYHLLLRIVHESL